jgi:Icc-related predicted phosphoesterase
LTETRLFFAADVHGSETTFRKFLAAARYYKPNIVMLSGDITGKVLVPIVKESDGTYSANFLGSNVVAKNEEQLKDLEKNIRLNGQYPFVTSEDEKARLDMDPKAVDQIFSDTMVAVAKRWTRIAEEKLKDSGVKCLIMPGN